MSKRRLERLVIKKPKKHECDHKISLTHTAKLPSVSLYSYLVVLRIFWVIPIEIFQIFILVLQICAPSLLSGMEKCCVIESHYTCCCTASWSSW
ncbi:hypothetical protein NC653_030901 [Populus alba x Populus x berolinensis]|uniref:Uncharacterized protein n=1 Tax=Populus alba x Populus x berolinensis TaxID=444605 RepID=A0AAD6LXH7_9ROSI|nr:hypothetical protein NC653_030901 [Populus alba x Populus x berolinensis]